MSTHPDTHKKTHMNTESHTSTWTHAHTGTPVCIHPNTDDTRVNIHSHTVIRTHAHVIHMYSQGTNIVMDTLTGTYPCMYSSRYICTHMVHTREHTLLQSLDKDTHPYRQTCIQANTDTHTDIHI